MSPKRKPETRERDSALRPPPTALPVARPLPSDHPLVTDATAMCPGCKERFLAGQRVSLVRIGPGNDEEQRRKARLGQVYIGVALPAHLACVTGEL